jgi:hypothetical protein
VGFPLGSRLSVRPVFRAAAKRLEAAYLEEFVILFVCTVLKSQSRHAEHCVAGRGMD